MANTVVLSTLPGLGRAGRLEVRLNAHTRATLQTHPVANLGGKQLYTALVPASPARICKGIVMTEAAPAGVFHLLCERRRNGLTQWLYAEGDLALQESIRRPRLAWKPCRPQAILPRFSAA